MMGREQSHHEPDHREFIEKLRQKNAKQKPEQTRYLWELIYRRRLLLLGVLGLIILATFNPIRCMLNRKDFRSQIEQTIASSDFDKAIVLVDELYKQNRLDRQGYAYYRRMSVEGRCKQLYETAESAFARHDFDAASKAYRGFLDFFYGNRQHLGVTSAAFSAFERDIYEEIKRAPADAAVSRKTETVMEDYRVILEGIAPDAESRMKLEMFLDAALKLKKIESELRYR